MEHLICFIIGIIFGWVLNELVNPIKRKAQRVLKEKSVRKALFSNEVIPGFKALEHGIPYYKKENIHLRDSGTYLFIAIPSKYRKEFSEYKFEIRESIYFDGSTNVLQAFNNYNIENPNKLLNTCVDEVALSFLSDLRNGFMRFNGLMYGVKKVRNERLTNEEEAGLDILFYKTDYFTYRVFAKIHEKLKNDLGMFKIGKLQDLNLYAPFLSGFGLGTLIIVNQGNGDEIVLGKRSYGVITDKGKWHYSMNEAFNLKDVDEYGHPSLSTCFYRGLQEELGLGKKHKKFIKKFELLDFIMDTNRFEIGMTSFARIELTTDFTLKNFIEDFYAIAQDGKLETSTITTLPIRKIDDFILENSNDISPICKGAMKALSARYKAGFLRDDSEHV